MSKQKNSAILTTIDCKLNRGVTNNNVSSSSYPSFFLFFFASIIKKLWCNQVGRSLIKADFSCAIYVFFIQQKASQFAWSARAWFRNTSVHISLRVGWFNLICALSVHPKSRATRVVIGFVARACFDSHFYYYFVFIIVLYKVHTLLLL